MAFEVFFLNLQSNLEKQSKKTYKQFLLLLVRVGVNDLS